MTAEVVVRAGIAALSSNDADEVSSSAVMW